MARLYKQSWNFIDDMDYVLGMNKIYLGLNKYALPLNAYVVVNPLVAEQSVDPILKKISASTEKFVTISRKNKFPTESDIKFFKSGGPVFSHTLNTMNEGWTVTYVGLQILYIKGCQTVYIVGMDHYFEQQGAPNSMQTMKGDDPNHFDSSYFKGNQWHLADLKQNEKHYKIARDEYEKDGRQIIDATIDGHCTVFEKIKSMKDAKTTTPAISTNEYTIKESTSFSTGCKTNCPYKHIGEYLKEPMWNFEGHSASKTNHVKSSTLVNFLGITNRYYIDIGSVAGSELSYLQNWKGLAIDPRETPSQNPTRTIISDAINPTNAKEILTKYSVPKEIGILKVDIDSYDYDVYESILKLRQPDLFFGELNPVFPPGVHFHLKYFKDFKWTLTSSRPPHLQIKYGASVQAMYDLLSMNGFTIVDVDWYNFIAVHNRYLGKFENIVPTDLETVWRNGWFDRPGRHSQKDLVTKHWLNYPRQETWVNKSPSEIIQEVHTLFDPLDVVYKDITVLSETNTFYQCLLAKTKTHQKGTIIKTLGECSQNDTYFDMLKDEPKGLCIDAGAHVGWTSVEMAKHGHEVLSIEPFEGNYKQFYEETQPFSSQITLVKGGVSDSEGFACFGGATTVKTYKKNVGDQNKDIDMGTSAVGAIKKGECTKKTKVYTVDTLASNRPIILLKIDVQGGELNVLKGALVALQSGRIKYVYFEHASGSTLETFRLLERYNYVCFEDKYLFSTSSVIRIKNREIHPEKLLSLTNGLQWMEARVPFGPGRFKDYL